MSERNLNYSLRSLQIIYNRFWEMSISYASIALVFYEMPHFTIKNGLDCMYSIFNALHLS